MLENEQMLRMQISLRDSVENKILDLFSLLAKLEPGVLFFLSQQHNWTMVHTFE